MSESTVGSGAKNAGLLHTIGQKIRAAFAAYRRRQTLHELAALDNHILQDIGVDRAELNATINQEADR
ncbi:MAG: DUF1127 domain-containing protein [Rhodospirillaceae bacterium]|nr:DUF1127 domain-containing protein [Rhodospirillaceae bacterium]MDD9928339.1 DUF1127 domain-containing protein [Rhodospirillaceae bacterium]